MSKPIHLKFDDKQEHQLLAIQSAVTLFAGLAKREVEFQMGDDVVPNLDANATLDESWLLSNLNEIRLKNNLNPQLTLDVDDGLELEDVGVDSWRFPSFTLEMETGTGKTYVYLRTIHELHKHYGFKKFVIVVPSVAIYEGVVKNIDITRSHFRSLYSNEQIHLTEYDGSQLSKLRSFASSTFLEVMVITLDSFNKKSNVIFKASEKLPGERKPYQYIQETRPILILDEPQNMESELAKASLRTLHPLLAFRYSATHKTDPNLVYRLTPIEAFQRNLVKKIEVWGVKEEENYNQLMLTLERIESYGPTVKIRTHVNRNGTLVEETIGLKKGDDLFMKTKRDAFKGGYIAETIDRRNGVVVFANQEELSVLEPTPLKPDIFRIQIEETIERHMANQERLRKHGIKVLSLFFIDRVANYVNEDGIIKKTFDAAFERLKRKYASFRKLDPEEVRSAYFAKKQTKQGEEVIDTSGKNAAEREAEKEAFRLIMKDKEKLLSFDESVSFIFAHSALKEGWDNPNVFQICTLNETRSEMKKRQEIGRGLRLCVNQNGDRVTDDGINVLTVVANDSYDSYVRGLQMEYTEDGLLAPPKPTSARKGKAKRNEKVFNSKDFKTFWSKLTRKTSYSINIDTEQLIQDCISLLRKATFPEPRIVVTRGKFVITTYSLELVSVSATSARIKISITDTLGKANVTTNQFEHGDDLSRKTHDDTLKGFKIVEIIDDGDESEVVFGNDESITKYKKIMFDSEAGQKVDSRNAAAAQENYPLFNFIERIAKGTGLTRPTVTRIFKGLPEEKKKLVFKNPEGFTATMLDVIKNRLADHIAERIVYTVGEGNMECDVNELFPESKPFPQKEVINGNERSMYDQVQIDSEIEKRFVEHHLAKEDEIVLFFKFPAGFKVHVPKIIGNYNPDWGIVRWTDDKTLKLELVRETKGSTDRNLLQYRNEGRKLACADKHFAALGIDYRDVKGDERFWWKKKEKANE